MAPFDLHELAKEAAQKASAMWQQFTHERPHALVQILKPNIPGTSPTFRRLAEPIVAAAAIVALLVLSLIGVVSSVTLLLALGLAFAIITHVFGIELSLDLPLPKR